MKIREAVEYIENIPRFTKKHTLDHTREFLKRLGSPEAGLKVIHVAGTNGKGSVCAYLQAMLLSEGKHVGMFTSPHLVSMNERIRIDGRQISDDDFLRVFRKVRDTARRMGEDGIAHPSYFEFLFGMGMTAFAESRPDYVILETGLGGRLDATNAVAEPVLTVITSISRDHTQYLGDTVEDIAREKAGIIKKGVPVICDGTDETALQTIRERARQMGAKCREITKNAYEIREITDKHIAFSRVNAYDGSTTWLLKGSGLYQAMNASLAIAAMEELFFLRRPDFGLPQRNDAREAFARWRDALARVVWEGRMEEITPGVFVDGAHNPGAVEAFVKSAGSLQGPPPVIVFAAVADKEYERMAAYLCRNLPAKAYVITEVDDPRKVPAKEMGEIFSRYTDREVVVCPRTEKAWEEAQKRRLPGERIYFLGSLYLAGMIKARRGELRSEGERNAEL